MITKDRITKLNYCLGAGDFKKADIIFFGEEPGTAREKGDEGKCIQAQIKEINESDKIYIEANKPEKGFTKRPRDGGYGGVIQLYQSRVMCDLNSVCGSNFNCFICRNKMDNTFIKKINEYRANSLYKEKSLQYKSCLIDYKPLIRSNGGAPWVYGIKRSDYEYIFNHLDKKNKRVDEFISNLFENRINMLKSLFKHSRKMQVVVCMGKRHWPRNKILLKYLFDNDSLTFKESDNGYLYTTHEMAGKSIHIFLTPFFGMGALKLEYLEKISRDLKNILSGN